MSRSKFISVYLPPLILTVTLSGFYLRTLAPGLSWANGGSDGGDLMAAAATGGVPHPTGYPLYLLLARAFQLFPIGSLAFRTNLMSALATVLASLLVYRIVVRGSKTPGSGGNLSAGLAAGFAFGLAPLVWSQAVITEVYALQSLLILVILSLYTRKDPGSPRLKKRLDGWRGLSLGLAMGNHITTILILPLALLLGSVRRKGDNQDEEGAPVSGHLSLHPIRKISSRRRPRRCPRGLEHFTDRVFDKDSLLRQLGWFGIGLSVYLILPIRALSGPPVNWGNPVTPARFWWLVSGGLYQHTFLPGNLAGVWGRLQAWASILLEQVGLPGLILGLLALIVYGRFSRLYSLTAWTALVFSAFAILYGSIDSYLYLIPVILAFSLWIGLGITGLGQETAGRFPGLGSILGVLMLAYFVGRGILNLKQVDASQDLRAEMFSQDVLTTVPADALIFAKGDQAVFALWYSHFGLRQRTDLVVIASDLLHFDWYQETLVKTYPGLKLPSPLPWPQTVAAANPTRPACLVEYTQETEIDCASPGTTP